MVRRLYVTAIASNYDLVARVLSIRGFRWAFVKIQTVQSESFNISFHDEWKLLMQRVQEVTQLSPVNEPLKSKTPLERFQKVMNPVRGHNDELSFSKALFRALRTSLGKHIDRRVSTANFVVLKNSQIGFGRGISRQKLGFPERYSLSKDNELDHGCFVLGTESAANQNLLDTGKVWCDDVTACIKIKLDKTSCAAFSVEENTGTYLRGPNLENRHGPLGQAMINSMDVWHCLARRGVTAKHIPVVLLAGKSKQKLSSESNPICCLEARIHIPEFCGNIFVYTVERIISFDGTTGLNTDNASIENAAVSPLKSRDERAIAIYIKTLRIGLEHAIQVSKNRNMPNPASPVSLCCHKLLTGDSVAQLIASPIPREDHVQESRNRIHQAELYQLTKPTRDLFGNSLSMYWFVDSRESDILATNCLVKVSCVSVHHTLVPLLHCERALKELYSACKMNSKLKSAISKVLLGYSFPKGFSLVLVMNDLRHEGFVTLDHQQIFMDKKLPELWTAFCGLVNALLLPMANEDIIHVDIRSDATITYNILCRHCSSNEMELCLIDLDSLLLTSSLENADVVPQDTAVHWEDLRTTVVSGVDEKSAYRYLFWQVLWIAYTWHLPSSLPEKLNATNFVFFLFTDSYYEGFKKWLGLKNLKALVKLSEVKVSTEATVSQALDILQDAFRSNANDA